MPVIVDIVADSSTRILVWQISEPEQELRSMLLLDERELAFLASIKVLMKRMQWLASRVLIRKIINTSEFILLNKTWNGQPVLSELGHHVSISHCGNYAAVIISKTSRVGIDIEIITDRVMGIRHKFISEQEKLWIQNNDDALQTLIIWSAKETIFKWYGKGQVDFRRNIFLGRFEVSQNGIIEALFRNEQVTQPIVLNYCICNSYVLTWLID